MVLSKPFDFATEAGLSKVQERVRAGLTRLNMNAAKIPLRWWVFGSDEAVASNQTEAEPGFAFQAAQAWIDKRNADAGAGARAYPDLKDDSRLQVYLKHEEHPYATFTSFKGPSLVWSAMDVLCNGPEGAALLDWKPLTCGDRVAHSPMEGKFTGKVVVIGENIASDVKVVRGLPEFGVDLQANYIEALLNGHYVHEAFAQAAVS